MGLSGKPDIPTIVTYMGRDFVGFDACLYPCGTELMRKILIYTLFADYVYFSIAQLDLNYFYHIIKVEPCWLLILCLYGCGIECITTN